MQPAVSVVILSHRKEFLPDAVRTVTDQTVENIQLINHRFPSSKITRSFSVQLAFTAILVPHGGNIGDPSIWLSSDTAAFTYKIP